MSTNQSHTSKQWLQQIAEGNQEAFKTLFDMYWDHIYTVAFVLTKSANMAEDMVQDIFLKIWQQRQKLATVEKLESYFFIVARNHIYTCLQKQRKEQAFRKDLLEWFSGNDATPEQQLLFKESTQLLAEAISRLTPQQQAIYKMTREEGLTHEQVAEQLHISPNTVRNHIVASLKIIRDYLSHHASPLALLIALLKTLE
ncbi:MAG: RNA polymerase sigma-70 factor [Chitinophagaceae bacterium]|nr:RNA polymerase sigma-70 factor [Chitinophagaceae bacterium]